MRGGRTPTDGHRVQIGMCRVRRSRVRKIDGADVHALGDRLVHQIDDEFAGVADIALGVLVAVARRRVGSPGLIAEHDDRRHRADRVEKAERRGVDPPVRIDRRRQRDRPRHDRADEQLVGFRCRDRRHDRNASVPSPGAPRPPAARRAACSIMRKLRLTSALPPATRLAPARLGLECLAAIVPTKAMKPPFSRTLFELLCEQAERFPERIAVICGERAVSYRDLADGAGRIAAALEAHGIGRGERVGILVNNRLEWLEACFGAAALGAVAVPFSTWSKPAELAYLLADSEVSALIAVDRFGGQDFAAAIAEIAPDCPRLRLVVMLGGDVRPGWIALRRIPRRRRAARAARSGGRRQRRRRRADPLHLGVERAAEGGAAAALRGDRERVQHRRADGARRRTTGCCSRRRCSGPTAPATPCRRHCRTARRWCCSRGSMPANGSAWSSGTAAPPPIRCRASPARCCGIRNFASERVASLRTGLMIGSPEEVRIAAERARRGADLQHLRLDRDLRQLLRHAVRLAARPRRMARPGAAAARREAAHRRSGDRRPLPPSETGALEVAGYVTPGYCGASAAAQRHRLYRGRLFPHRRSRLCRRGGRLSFRRARRRHHQARRDQRVAGRDRDACCCSIPRWRRRRWSAPRPARWARRSSRLSCRNRVGIVGGEELRAHCRAARIELQGARPYRTLRRAAGHRNRQTVPPRAARAGRKSGAAPKRGELTR